MLTGFNQDGGLLTPRRRGVSEEAEQKLRGDYMSSYFVKLRPLDLILTKAITPAYLPSCEKHGLRLSELLFCWQPAMGGPGGVAGFRITDLWQP
ncbi:hypothetical protein YC2023_058680 [Brassica napus]|uniref:(rape) hypothetical protein n=1 Tax=Brassica napus TaxID=3708 RepID=A0A816L1E9_BRANA|nr:unnamed protein product [Brassica napus]